jgi:hypothetical protein
MYISRVCKHGQDPTADHVQTLWTYKEWVVSYVNRRFGFFFRNKYVFSIFSLFSS